MFSFFLGNGSNALLVYKDWDPSYTERVGVFVEVSF